MTTGLAQGGVNVACAHPPASLRSGVVPPIGGDSWSRDRLAHVWVACGRCGRVLRDAPYAVELERLAAGGGGGEGS
jgi:hypothetical protein